MEKENTIRIGDLQMLFEICEEEFKSWTQLKKLIDAYENEGKELKFISIGELYAPMEDYKFSKEIYQGKFALNKSFNRKGSSKI